MRRPAVVSRNSRFHKPSLPSHYILYEGHDIADDKGIPVYQSMSTGMLFAEDATPLIYAEDRLLDAAKLARAIIEVSGWTEELERIANGCVMRKEHFARVLEKEQLK